MVIYMCNIESICEMIHVYEKIQNSKVQMEDVINM